MAVIILVVVAAVITWDLTHRSLPAGGVEAPEAAAASDEWLATLDNQSEGVSLLLQNLSAADSMSVGVDVPGLSLDSTHALRQDVLAVANGSSLLIYDVHQPDRALSVFEFEQPEHLLVCERGSSLVVVYTLDGVLNVMDLQGQPIPFSDEVHDGVERLTCSGSEIAYVTAERPMEVTVLQLGVRGEVGYTINATAPQEEDAILEAWGTPVDMANATVQSMAFDREYLAVTVNVSATDRLVLYNRSTAEQWLASNAKYHVSDISLDHGILAWSVRDHLNPLAPQDKYLDREIYFTELDTNTSYVLTSDYKDQWGPLVLEHQLVYFELDDDVMSMEIHAWEPELRLYSSIVLQAGVLLAFFVVAWNMWQRQSERRLARQP